jgi:hypothetical protein
MKHDRLQTGPVAGEFVCVKKFGGTVRRGIVRGTLINISAHN